MNYGGQEHEICECYVSISIDVKESDNSSMLTAHVNELKVEGGALHGK